MVGMFMGYKNGFYCIEGDIICTEGGGKFLKLTPQSISIPSFSEPMKVEFPLLDENSG